MNNSISVIIPVHNAELYLAECIDSVIGQLDINDEIILVENGSTDMSALICEEYSRRFPNIIKYICCEIIGVSNARNEGIKAAVNEWITFVDSDDMLYDRALLCIRNSKLPKNAEIIIAGYSRERNVKGAYDIEYKRVEGNILVKSVLRFAKYKRAVNKIAYVDDFNNWTCWGKFYKRHFLVNNNIFFPINVKLSEDTVFCFQSYCVASYVFSISNTVYYYRSNEQSAIHGYKRWLYENNLLVIQYIENYRRRYLKSSAIFRKDFAAFYASKVIEVCRCMRDERYGKSANDKVLDLKKIYEIDCVDQAIKDAQYLFIVNGKKNNVIYALYLYYLKHHKYKRACCK